MVRNPEKLRAFEDAYVRREPLDPMKNLRVVNDLFEYAYRLGVIGGERSFGDLDAKIRVARALNG